MKKIVIDTSAVIAVILNEPEKAALVNLTNDSELIAPSSIPWEIGNAFSAMFKRKKLSFEEAEKALEEYRKIPIRFVNINISHALKIAINNNIYAYDAYLISCSKRYRAPLLTLDNLLKEIAIQCKVNILGV